MSNSWKMIAWCSIFVSYNRLCYVYGSVHYVCYVYVIIGMKDCLNIFLEYIGIYSLGEGVINSLVCTSWVISVY